MPPPFFNPNMPPSPGPRRPIVYAGQGPSAAGSQPMPHPGVRPAQQYMGFKQPYPGQGFHQDYPQPGYFHTPEGWRPGPPPTLQKKPKELDKAMWVGNVLNDTTVAELQAIFEAEPTEAEGDVEHDIPESIFILSKSHCAFVNYSSHEAVDRAVRRFHDREFKNTRLVCRPRKDPASDYVNKVPSSNRFQHQAMHYGQPPYMSESMGYYNHDHPLLAQRMDPRYELSDTQTRIERMRLEASPAPGSSSSGGDGSTSLEPFKHKEKGGSKKSRSTSSLGYAESRYFILKGLNDEDLKLSVQYGLWATQDHLVPLLNEAFSNSKNVFLVFSANKSGEFFGCARMLDLISVENEIAITTGKEDEIWQPAGELSLSPEMKAAMLVEIEQAAKEGRKITNEEAEVIARASTTTKSWGVRFPIQWLHVEVKVSKDGTEVDPAVGEQLIKLFIKSSRDQPDRSSMDDTESRSTSEAGGSRRGCIHLITSKRSRILSDMDGTPRPATVVAVDMAQVHQEEHQCKAAIIHQITAKEEVVASLHPILFLTLPPHPGYAGQGPPAGYHAPYPPPGYPVMQPYMGYPYMPGPTPYMPGAMPWHPGQGPPIAANMMPGPGMVPGHATSLPPMPGTNADGAGMDGMVPLIGYDGVAYGYIPAEEAYSQQLYGYGFMPHDHDPHTSEQTEPTVSSNESDEAGQGHGDPDSESSGRQSGHASSPSVRDTAEGDPTAAEGLSSASESPSEPTATVTQSPGPTKD
ncbi:hypothetical protein BGZ67_000924 [Mortierella alpina]|nr:hypothetical protein BGZ67_000924 [Mortierella alpina]